MRLTNNELKNINGGAISINGSTITAIYNVYKGIVSLGKSIGSTLYQFTHKNYCR